MAQQSVISNLLFLIQQKIACCTESDLKKIIGEFYSFDEISSSLCRLTEDLVALNVECSDGVTLRRGPEKVSKSVDDVFKLYRDAESKDWDMPVYAANVWDRVPFAQVLALSEAPMEFDQSGLKQIMAGQEKRIRDIETAVMESKSVMNQILNIVQKKDHIPDESKTFAFTVKQHPGGFSKSAIRKPISTSTVILPSVIDISSGSDSVKDYREAGSSNAGFSAGKNSFMN